MTSQTDFQDPRGVWWHQEPDGLWHFWDQAGGWTRAENMGRPPAFQSQAVQRTATEQSMTPVGAWFAVVAGVMATIAAFLPWVSFSAFSITINRNAFQLGQNLSFSADGVAVVALGVVTSAIGIARITRTSMPHSLSRSTIATGIGLGIIPAIDHSSLANLVDSVRSGSSGLVVSSFGAGFYLTCVAAGLAIIAGFVLRHSVVTGQSHCSNCGKALYPLAEGSAEVCGHCGAVQPWAAS